jgi:hypothetical protein
MRTLDASSCAAVKDECSRSHAWILPRGLAWGPGGSPLLLSSSPLAPASPPSSTNNQKHSHA